MSIIEISRGNNVERCVVDRLVVAGWVGKDQAAVQRHIDELAELGVKPPGRVPTYMNLSPSLLTADEMISFIGPNSSGEVEAVVITAHDGNRYLTVGSDHTDREFEKYDIPASKQMCAKPLAKAAWLLNDVENHLPELILRSWLISDGERRLYQQGTLAENRDPRELLGNMPTGCVAAGESFCLYCGTFAAIGGLAYGERFEFELFDPVRKRSITHGYTIHVLPQYI